MSPDLLSNEGRAVPPVPAWQAPTDIERGLYEAKTRGDWAAYFDVLATANLYHAMSRTRADSRTGCVSYTPTYWGPHSGTKMLAFLTDGMLPAPVPDPIFFQDDLGELARNWPQDDEWLAINPGSPCEAFFPATAAHRMAWRRHADRMTYPRRNELRTLWAGGPLHGPVAHGLACGALLCMNNASLWNAMGWHGTGYVRERKRLKEWWGISSREEWLSAMEALLDGRMSSPFWGLVLGVRSVLARDFGGRVEVDHWRQVTSRVIRSGGPETDTLPGGGTALRSGSETEAQVAGAQRLIGRITRYEARFRADGLLAEGGFVHGVEAWDYGRASKMARWGLGARYCDLPEAEQAVLRAGRLSGINYRSWEDFSAAYILGRCLHFDEEEFGDWYGEMLDAHRILTTDPNSPWLNIPFKQ
ncbi:DUF1266 domain-containing protein [Nonomuraea cavernae]|uniref:DUF1266 domain-containing protein n=1 Tax=Nonomuraea cavernae TaxID=2045107 RepID=A0A917ZGD0_9ACTN|nr:DUF1266 domain-containing protein [Nonomuraea cavernae]MCA2189451.1 DUF1266 domain-containing protein [Nonomuraea cavernae]GGO82238.1 hypothetical protein GCM10012289_73020 [Nonomuraea cavernae]